jgi:hypothetical protein
MLRPSGDTSVALAEFSARGWTQSDGAGVAITGAGVDALGDYEPLPTGRALRDHLLSGGMSLSSAERKILAAAFEMHPRVATRAEFHERAGLKPSGDTSVAFAKFLTLGWLEQKDGGLVASEVFY